MYLDQKAKEKLFKKHGKNAQDTGSAEGQIALFTERINHLTEHLKKNRNNYQNAGLNYNNGNYLPQN